MAKQQAESLYRGSAPGDDYFQTWKRMLGEFVESDAPEEAKAGPRLTIGFIDSFEKSGYTPEARHLLWRIAREAALSPADTMTQALGLYKIALDATKGGHRLAILDDDDAIVQEIEEIIPKAAETSEPEPAKAGG